MNPFRYPEERLARLQTPGHFSDYRRYKPYLRAEFSRQCAYCRMPDGLRGHDSFGVDHYRPRALFPFLSCEYVNLFYSCNHCNRLKRDFWPTEEEWADGLFLPNPCDHTMSQHLRFNRDRVTSVSQAGELAINLLLLNDELTVEFRAFVLRSIERCLEWENILVEALLQAESHLGEARQPQISEIRLEIARLRVQLASVQADLERLTSRVLSGERPL